ncbi:MAG: NUDIX domain-containing protein [Promethearchaeota archaeon]
MIQKWKLIGESTVFKSFPYNVAEKIYKKPKDGGEFNAYVIQAPTWANVIGRTVDYKILLIRQYRFGTDKVELEIPGGMIEPGESPLAGVQRELEEETGFISTKWKQIGVVDANPAIQNNKCYTFLADEIEAKGSINFDPDEDIEFEFATLEEVRAYVANGQITNTFIIAAMYWMERDLHTIP